MVKQSQTKITGQTGIEEQSIELTPTAAVAVAKPARIQPRPLFDIAPDFLAVLAAIEEAGGELDGENGVRLEAWLMDVALEAGVKMDQYINAIRLYENDAEERIASVALYRKEIEAQMQSAGQSNKAVERLKARLCEWLIATEQTRFATPKGRKLTVCANGGAPSLDRDTCSVIDPELKEFVVTVQAIDEAKLLAAMKAGREFTNARVKPKGSHVRIS